MQLYELLFIIIPSITDDEVSKTIEHIVTVIKKGSKSIHIKTQKTLGRRKFTYAIKHLAEGTYVLIDFEAETIEVHSVNRILELEDLILRHMIVKKEIKSADQIAREEKLKEEIKQTNASESRARNAKSHKKLVQKTEELPTKKEQSIEFSENLDEKLDEILKREIS